MEFSGEYDFVVLGEHPAGLWAALRLLQLERKVLVLPFGRDSGLNVLPKVVLRDFGWEGAEWLAAPADPIQILTPERRFRVGGTAAEVDAEYEFQFGTLPGESPSPEILRGLAYLARGSETGPVFSADWKLWVQRAIDAVYVEKEPGFLIRNMLRHLASLGAHVAKTGQLKQVFVDKKALVGVQLEGTSRMISTRSGLICSHYDFVKSHLNETLPALSEPIGWNLEMKFECAPSSRPSGLSRRMVYVETGAPVLEIIQPSPGYFNLRTPLPLSGFTMSRGYQRRLCERMIKVCERIIPDLEYNLRRVVPDLRDPEKTESVDLPMLYPFESVTEVPAGRLFFSASKSLGCLSPVQNLYIASEESYPRVGFRGAYQAAIQFFESLNKRDQVNHYLSSSHINEFN
jgi:hypothetical protein